MAAKLDPSPEVQDFAEFVERREGFTKLGYGAFEALELARSGRELEDVATLISFYELKGMTAEQARDVAR